MDKSKRTQQVLKQFGLSANESLVYQSALSLGETSPFKIAKSTGIARTTVYAVLTDLALKGLVELESATGLMKQQTKVRAKNPSALREILWKKRESLVKQEVDIVEILPFLKKEYLKDETNADFQFFPGMDGANHVMFDYDGIDQDTYVFDYQIPMDATGSKEMNEGIDKGIELWSKGKSTEYNLTPLNPWTKHVLSYQVERNPHYLDRVQYPISHLKLRVSPHHSPERQSGLDSLSQRRRGLGTQNPLTKSGRLAHWHPPGSLEARLAYYQRNDCLLGSQRVSPGREKYN